MNRDAYSFSFSFLIHASILGVCLYLLPTLDLQPKPLVIDFSLIPSSGSPDIYSVPLPKEKNRKSPPVLQAPLKPAQLTTPRPIKKVLNKTPLKQVLARKVLSRPAEKILPKKEEEVVNEESIPEVAEHTRAEPETFVPQPVMQPRAATRESKKAGQALGAVALSSSVVSMQEMEQHYVKAHFVYIKKIIEKNISYPPMARRMGWQGKVVVSFIVCSNGEVEKLQVVESSGHAQLDKNALETVRQVGPFPRPPVRVKLVLPVMYTIT